MLQQKNSLGRCDDPHWRDTWPTNLMIVRGLIEPSLAQSPTVDGVNRIRTTMLVTEIDPDAPEQVGLVARIPVLVLTLAYGYSSIASGVSAARRRKQPGQHLRVEPVMIEARGISKRIEDRDTRFAEPRRTNPMAVEISTVRRIHKGSEQLSFWRGRGTVASHRPFNLGDHEFLRVTLKVPSARHRSYLRGPALNEDPVDVLVSKDHPHDARFRRISQKLLVEAQVTSQTTTHPLKAWRRMSSDVSRRCGSRWSLPRWANSPTIRPRQTSTPGRRQGPRSRNLACGATTSGGQRLTLGITAGKRPARSRTLLGCGMLSPAN